MKRYEYGVTLRPPSRGNVPDGFVGKRGDDGYNFGVVQYTKPLSRADVEHYNLVPIDPGDPANLRAARDAFHARVLDTFSDQDIFVVENDQRRGVLTWSTRPDVEWQLTYFDAKGVPTGHDDFNDFDKAVGALFGFMPPEELKSLAAAAIPVQIARRRHNPAPTNTDLVRKLKF